MFRHAADRAFVSAFALDSGASHGIMVGHVTPEARVGRYTFKLAGACSNPASAHVTSGWPLGPGKASALWAVQTIEGPRASREGVKGNR